MCGSHAGIHAGCIGCTSAQHCLRVSCFDWMKTDKDPPAHPLSRLEATSQLLRFIGTRFYFACCSGFVSSIGTTSGNEEPPSSRNRGTSNSLKVSLPRKTSKISSQHTPPIQLELPPGAGELSVSVR